MTMILVMCVVAIATVLALVMLSSAALHQQAGRDATHVVSADSLADSGLELACYYLQNPGKAPSVGAGGFWTGGTGIQFSGDGAADVTVSSLGSGDYEVISTGRVSAGGATIRRSSHARIHVDSGYQVVYAVASNASTTNFTLKTTITGDVQASDVLNNSGTISGQAFANVVNNLGLLLNGWTSLLTAGVPASVVPSSSDVRDYSTYAIDGTTYSAATITTLSTGAVLGPTPDNPGGVFIYDGTLTIPDNVTINGTLVVNGGPLNVNSSTSVITSNPGFPALVVKGDIILRGSALVAKGMTVNGLAWTSGSVKSAIGAKGNLDFHGALLFGGSGSVDSLYAGKLNVWYEPDKIGQVNLDTKAPPPGVRFLQYSNRKDSL